MIQLRQLVPTNLQEEKVKFMADTSYNPQFTYTEVLPQKELRYYGKAEKRLRTIAELIVTTHVPLYLLRLAMKERDAHASNEEIQAETITYLQELGLADRYTIVFKKEAVSRCSITANTITFRSQADYTKQTLLATLNHEVGTHALRRNNDETQPWHGKRKRFDLKNPMVTEEGLAVLHQQLEQRIPTLYNSAVRYLANDLASEHSFVELWRWLTPYIRNEEKRWAMCFRAKRGLTDTSQKGGYSKDLVYFKGAYQVSQWLAEHDFDLTRLYYGKISCNDVDRVEKLEINKNLILPTFFSQNPVEYARKITRIREINSFV